MKKQLRIAEKDLIIETGKMARQAHGSVTVQYGETMVLVTAVSPDQPREGIDFFPLTVDYREKTSAAGRFPGGYIKREARPTEKEILTCRLTDRPLRPLFPEGYLNEVQIMSSVLSADGESDPDILTLNGASAALTISDIPFAGPVGATRIGWADGKYIVNPSYTELEKCTLNLTVAGTRSGISMIEGESKGVSEQVILDGLQLAQEQITKLVELQLELQKAVGKPKKEPALVKINEKVQEAVAKLVEPELAQLLQIKEKNKRQNSLKELREKAISQLQPDFPEESESAFKGACRKLEKNKIRDLILLEGKRTDGRAMDEIRPITCEVGLLPRTHGSALFTRGETQSLAITTLGTVADEQRIEGYTGESRKSFMLHYNFPPFSVGEVRPVRGPGRREIGHGALAEKSLQAVMPDPSVFPYTVRIVSDILESNGSSSMASVCGGSLTLMDAGVPITDAVAGIAMGLVSNGEKFVVLSDILGSEDACGFMDFKVAGTKSAVTSIQLDVKLPEGISMEIIKATLDQAHRGRLHILGKMAETISKSRDSVSNYAPRIEIVQIDPDKIGAVIGPGGRVIKRIIEETDTSIEVNDDGKVTVSGTGQESIEKAVATIKALTHEVEVGNVYEGTVRTIMDFGAFVELVPGKDGLVHVSELSEGYVKKAADVVKVGDKMRVVVIKVDERGRINLSAKRAPK